MGHLSTALSQSCHPSVVGVSSSTHDLMQRMALSTVPQRFSGSYLRYASGSRSMRERPSRTCSSASAIG